MSKRLWLCIAVVLLFLATQAAPAWCDDSSGTGGEVATTATLTVITQVTNSNAGTLLASNFTVHVNSVSDEVYSDQGVESPGITYSLAPGDYTISEDAQTGYTSSFSGCDSTGSITLAAGDDKTVTINNQDQATGSPGGSGQQTTTATLHVITVVTNSNGGTKTASDFKVHITSGGNEVGIPQAGSDSGTAYNLAPGDYTVNEDAPTGYTSSFSGDGDASGSISLATGDDKTITITNQDQAATPPASLQVVNIPLDGATDVATGPTDIKITFNQPIVIDAYPEAYGQYFDVSGKYNIGLATTPLIDPADSNTLILSVNLPEDDTITVTVARFAIAEAVNVNSTLDQFSFRFTTHNDTGLIIPDQVLKQAIKDKLGIPDDREIHPHEDNAQIPGSSSSGYVPIKAMDDLTEFTYPATFDQYFGTMIQNIEGLEHAVNLETLHLFKSEINDLSPLTNLAHLQEVELSGSTLGAISLAPLATLPLTHLELAGCDISDISSLQTISTLQYLRLDSNPLSSIAALEHLTGLTYLDLSGDDQISDFTPIGKLGALEHLGLNQTGVGDISFLSGLTSLQELEVTDNFIVATGPLSGLSNLHELDLSRNCIFDLSPLLAIVWPAGDFDHRIDLIGNQDMDEDQYRDFIETMKSQGVNCDNGYNHGEVYPSSSDPADEDVGVDGTGQLVLSYDDNNAVDLKRLQLGNYFSKIRIYVNGVYDDTLTKSLSFDPNKSTPQELYFNHDPFPNASTITIQAPIRLRWEGMDS